MSGLALASLVVVALWLGILTLLVLLIIRQVGLLTARSELAGHVFDVSRDGLEIGASVPAEVIDALPESVSGVTYVLRLSASCAPCRELASVLGREGIDRSQPIVALIAGRTELADGMATMLPPAMRSIRDPQATTLAESLRIQSVPFALTIENGVVAGKAYLRSAADLSDLFSRIETRKRAPNSHPEPVRREGLSHVG